MIIYGVDMFVDCAALKIALKRANLNEINI